MRSMIKQVAMMGLTCSMCVSAAMTSLAAEGTAALSQNAQSVSEEAVTAGPGQIIDAAAYGAMGDEELKAALVKIGISEAEAARLVQLKVETERQQENQAAYGSIGGVGAGAIRPYSFPSNPSVGDTCWVDYYVELSDVSDAAKIYSAAVAAGVNPAAATVVAAAALVYYADHPVQHGIHVKVEYYYGPNNDGVIMWTYRRVTWEAY